MSENNTSDWTVGITFVQFAKNSSHYAGIGQSPYWYGSKGRTDIIIMKYLSALFRESGS